MQTSTLQVVSEKMSLMLKLPNGARFLMAIVGLGVGLLLLIPEIIFW